MDEYSYIGNADVAHINGLYESYKKDPESVDGSWRLFFQGFEFTASYNNDVESNTKDSKETAVKNLIHAYRSRAHLKSDTNPVRDRRNHDIKLDLDNFGLSLNDLETSFQVGKEIGLGSAKLKDIVTRLKKIYLGSIGYATLRQDLQRVLAEIQGKPDPNSIIISGFTSFHWIYSKITFGRQTF